MTHGKNLAVSPKTFESFLHHSGHLNTHQLHLLTSERRQHKSDINQLLVTMGLLTRDRVRVLYEEWQDQANKSLAFVKKCDFLHHDFDRTQAETLQAVPLEFVENCLTVAMVFNDCVTKDKLRHLFKGAKTIKTHTMSLEAFYHLLDQIYGKKNTTPFQEKDAADVETFLNGLLTQAIKLNASDIHFEPSFKTVKVRLRLDGTLRLLHTFHYNLWASVVTRLKVLSNLDITQTRQAQTGRYSYGVDHHQVDCRISTHPTQYGESVVIRLLDQSKELTRLDRLGFSPALLSKMSRLMTAPQGLIVVTGPTGSGKTTTLYALLSSLNAFEKKIVTLEDPIEYKLSHIQQTEINETTGFGFAEGLRSLMRQDPDVILVGEIRDADTAAMAVRAALTGHLVLTTLHTSDALGTIPRLMDLGISSGYLTEVLTGLISQRLLRLVCPHCHDAGGCEACYFTGHKGRLAVAELIDVEPYFRHLLAQNANRSLLYQALKDHHQHFMEDEAKYLMNQGYIKQQEAIRVLGQHAF